jgi:subtilase family serine protease
MYRSPAAILAALLSSAGVALAALPAVAVSPAPAIVAPAAAAAPAAFAVTLPLRDRAGLETLLAELQDPASPHYQKFLTQAQFATRFGPSAAAKAAIASELRAAGFQVHVASQGVFARGPQAAAERYFSTRLVLTRPALATSNVLAPASPLHYSRLLTALHASVIGLDGLPDWHSNAVFGKPVDTLLPFNINGANGPYAPPALRQAYSYPSYKVATGAKTSIGIISSSPVSTEDVDEFVAGTGNYAPGNTYPEIFEFPIDGGGPYNPSGGATGEVTLDVEYSLGSAPGAEIGVFNVPSLTNNYLLEGYSAAVAAEPYIISTSIGGCEKAYDNTAGIKFLNSLHSVFAEGISEGIAFVGASGDNGAFECGTGKSAANVSVQTPTDDPLMIGVGGTTDLRTTYAPNDLHSAYVSETSYDTPFTGHGGSVWGSCGGYSVLFAQPSYQKGFVTGKYRGVPDLAMHMGGPAKGMSGDQIIVGGQLEVVFGTSAAAPEFAGLLALRVQITKKPLGDLHTVLYNLSKKSGAFRPHIKGDNGEYSTTNTPWDPVLGLGTPYGRVIDGDPTAALAGDPRSTSNP